VLSGGQEFVISGGIAGDTTVSGGSAVVDSPAASPATRW
jgi:hypothetical protein